MSALSFFICSSGLLKMRTRIEKSHPCSIGCMHIVGGTVVSNIM